MVMRSTSGMDDERKEKKERNKNYNNNKLNFLKKWQVLNNIALSRHCRLSPATNAQTHLHHSHLHHPLHRHHNHHHHTINLISFKYQIYLMCCIIANIKCNLKAMIILIISLIIVVLNTHQYKVYWYREITVRILE